MIESESGSDLYSMAEFYQHSNKSFDCDTIYEKSDQEIPMTKYQRQFSLN